MDFNYQDIIKKTHHTSKTRKRMSVLNRAAQFAPFAALTGHDLSILEAARLTEEQIPLDDEAIKKLNIKLNFIKEHLKAQPQIGIIYFVPDSKKSGGAYFKYTGNIRAINEVSKELVMIDETIISINMIHDIDSEIFEGINFDFDA